jgi:hypothetical protein
MEVPITIRTVILLPFVSFLFFNDVNIYQINPFGNTHIISKSTRVFVQNMYETPET